MRDGREVEEAVALNEYRALRWYPGALAPNQMLAFTARVRVIDDRSPAVKGSGK